MKDPIKVVQKILDKIYNHLLFIFIEEQFHERFSRPFPSVNGIAESIFRTKGSTTESWGRSLEIKGDFSDLYSNCNKALLLKGVRIACGFDRFDNDSIKYISLCITCIMDCSYLRSLPVCFNL